MRKVLVAIAGFAAVLSTQAIAAPPATAVASWTGAYIGVDAGYGWNSDQLRFSPNDVAAADLFGGLLPDGTPVITSLGLHRSAPVGGLAGGYNWQIQRDWVAGLEADFSFTGLSGRAAGSSVLTGPPFAPVGLQTISVQQATNWYGTVRGRLGFLATPHFLFFGTGGLAYGQVFDSVSYSTSGGTGGFAHFTLGHEFNCTNGSPCFFGSSSAVRIGWTAGGGAEWQFAPHVSLKAEYQLVDFGTRTITSIATFTPFGNAPSSFSASPFRDQFQIVRVGLNWHL